ncbi:MAG TPA: RHS repeat protein [Clostridiales bacterium]|nr:RHS repeat protein [Clostridiales bacterium]
MKKSYFNKVCASILIISLVVGLIPYQASASTQGNESNTVTYPEDSEPSATPDNTDAKPTLLYELRDERDENEKRFLMSDNTVQAVVYPQPVHYYEDGEWKDIDNTLSLEAAKDSSDFSGYTNARAGFKVKIAGDSAQGNLAKIQKGKYSLAFSLAGKSKGSRKFPRAVINKKENKAPDKSNRTSGAAYEAYKVDTASDTVSYGGITSDSSDIEYQVTGTGLKEDIIIKSKQASYVYTFDIQVANLKLGLKDNIITAADDATGKVIYELPAPFMYDANNEFSAKVFYSLAKKGSVYQLTVTADSEWINGENIKFPVTIDPTVTITKPAVSSTFISSKMATTNFYSGYNMLLAGVESTAYNSCRTLIKFQLPQLAKGDIVTDAYLNINQYDANAYAATTPASPISVYKLTSAWDVSTVNWNTKPNYDYLETDYFTITKDEGSKTIKKTLDITKIVKEWYDGNAANYGIMLKAEQEGTQNTVNSIYAKFKSERSPETTLYPSVVLTYRNMRGTESYYSYTGLGVGSAGTAYINDYTGNLYFEQNEISTGGQRMPASVYLTYNVNTSDSESFSTGLKCGYGWKLNIEQYIKKTGNPNYPYQYTDADGTVHYFKKIIVNSTPSYVDEDGLGLTLVDTPNVGYTITDQQDTVYTFSTYGNLLNIRDSNGNVIKLTYSSGIIQSVTDGAGRKITISSSGGTLTQIKDAANRVTVFTIENGDLKKVTNPDGTVSSYDYYASHVLKHIIDPDAYKLSFSYLTQGMRVETATEYGGSSLGQKMGFNYSDYNTTKITTSGVDDTYDSPDDIVTTCQFDDWGRLISTQAKAGGKQLNATDIKFTGGLTDDTIKKANRVAYSNGMGASTDNLLLNHNVESTDNWAMIKTGTCTETVGNSAYAYLGGKSLKIAASSATAESSIRYRQMLTSKIVKPGEYYTFSGYINTLEGFTPLNQDSYGAALLVYCYLPDGTTKSFYSDFITSATNNKLNNGWRRLDVTFRVPDNATNTSVNLVLKNTNGSAYFDALQLEEGKAANAYNLLENSSFENLDALYGYATNDLDLASSDIPFKSTYVSGGTSFRMIGDKAKNKYISQEVAISGNESDLYVISGWAKASSLPEFNTTSPTGEDRRFKISILVTYSDGSSVWKDPVVFNHDIVGWQYGAVTIDLSDGTTSVKTPTKIAVYPRYGYQGNTVYFDDLSITKDNVASYSAFQYDNNGNTKEKSKNISQKTGAEYNNTNDITSVTDANGNKTSYGYDVANPQKHNLTQVKTQRGVVTKFTYDKVTDTNPNANTANVVKSVIQNNDNDSLATLKIQTGTSYTPDGAYVETASDQDGNTTTYSYDQDKGLLKSTIDVNGNTTSYDYYGNTDQLKSVSATVSTAQGAQTVTNSYEYRNNYLKKLTHNGFYYDFDYDEFGNNKAVKVGTQSLIKYNYNHNNGSLQSVLYGNQDTTSYTYDEYGNVTNVAVNGVDRYQSYANKLGNITKHGDLLNKQLYSYEYDINGRLVRQSVEDTSKAIGKERNLYLLEYAYDNMDNISGFINKVGKKALKHSYAYTADNLLNSYTMPAGKTVSYTYDGLNRLKQYQVNTATPLTVAYEYEASKRNTGGGSTYQTTKVSRETAGNRGTSYTYDKVGNITGISEKNPDGTYGLTNSYKYDELNQLIREDDAIQGKTKVYTYDLGGNIISVKEYAYTLPGEEPADLLNTVAYEYTDANWKDKLTSYNGQPITYDGIGNPTSYNGYTFGWDNGRELSTLSGNGVTASYTYDADGLRATKTVNGVKTTYEYVGGQLAYEKKGSTELHYFYDTNGSLKGIQTVDSAGTVTTYYTVTNTRGDVTQIYDAAGTLQVQYAYDTWGKILSIKDGNGTDITSDVSIGKLNSLRYRGYYYDEEACLYYLQSRYYDPQILRFLNIDGQINKSILGTNLFMYCENNPVNMIDSDGYFAIPLLPYLVEGVALIFTGAVYVYGSIKQMDSRSKLAKEQVTTKSKEVSKDSKGRSVPKTGKWVRVGQKLGKWMSDNKLVKGKRLKGNPDGTGKQGYEVLDAKGNVIGRIDTGYKIDGKGVPDHFHLKHDPAGNVHYWFD